MASFVNYFSKGVVFAIAGRCLAIPLRLCTGLSANHTPTFSHPPFSATVRSITHVDIEAETHDSENWMPSQRQPARRAEEGEPIPEAGRAGPHPRSLKTLPALVGQQPDSVHRTASCWHTAPGRWLTGSPLKMMQPSSVRDQAHRERKGRRSKEFERN